MSDQPSNAPSPAPFERPGAVKRAALILALILAPSLGRAASDDQLAGAYTATLVVTGMHVVIKSALPEFQHAHPMICVVVESMTALLITDQRNQYQKYPGSTPDQRQDRNTLDFWSGFGLSMTFNFF